MERGTDWVRLAVATARGGDIAGAQAIARTRWGNDSIPYRVLKAGGPALLLEKAAIPAGATPPGNWAASLVDLESAASEFWGYCRERSLLGKIAGFRRVPLRVRLVGAVSGFSAAWIGEGQSKPVGKAAFAEKSLPARKVVAMCVVTDELLESADPAAEVMIRADMAGALVEAIDASFIDPANAGESDVEPASIAFGAPSAAVAAPGDITALGAALAAMVANFGGYLERAYFVGRAETLAFLGSNGFAAAPEGLGARGGTLAGVPAVPSKGLPLGADGKPQLVLIDPAGIALGEAEMDLRVSREGTIEIADDPAADSTTPSAAQGAFVSLWQTNSAAILSEKRINFERVQDGAVSVLTGLPGGTSA